MEHHFHGVEADHASGCIRVEAGVKLQALAAKAAEAGLIVPLGTAPSVGIGLILQGGVGHLTRRLGLALDAVQSIQLVLAAGDVVTVDRESSDESKKDLFWALCGCGPNFGVVTSLELKAAQLQSFRATRHIFRLPTSTAEATTLLRDYMLRARSLTRDCCSDCCLYMADDLTEQDGMLMGIYDSHC